MGWGLHEMWHCSADVGDSLTYVTDVDSAPRRLDFESSDRRPSLSVNLTLCQVPDRPTAATPDECRLSRRACDDTN